MSEVIKIVKKNFTHRQIADGVDSNIDSYEIQSNIPIGQKKALNDFVFEARDGSYFEDIPRVETDSRGVEFKLVKTRKTKKRITGCIFTLSYRNIGDVSSPKISFKYKTVKFVDVKKGITSFKIKDNRYVDRAGETVSMRIIGTAGSKYCISVSESFLNDDGFIDYTNNESMLPSTLPKVKHHGKSIPVIQGVLDGNSKVIKQKIPSTIVHNTKITSAVGGGKTAVQFNNISKVRKGDRLRCSQIKHYENIIVEDVDYDNNRLNLNTNITTTNPNLDCYFERSRVYTIELIKEFSTINQTSTGIISSSSSIRKLYQYMQPNLRFAVVPNHADITITSDNGAAITGTGRNVSYTKFFSGKQNYGYSSMKSYNKDGGAYHSYVLVLTLHDAAHRWKTFTPPSEITLRSDIKEGSEEANNLLQKAFYADAGKNYSVCLKDFKSSALNNGTNTVTLSFKIYVDKFGAEDARLTLPLTSIYTFGAP